MITPGAPLRSVIVERNLPHPPEKVWRALTEPSFVEQWLMQNDLQPVPGHAFTLRTAPMPHWDGTIACKVLAVDPFNTLSYTWAALSVESVVTFTLTRTEAGTHLRVEQAGFRPDQEPNYKGAQYGWQKFLGSLERVLADLPKPTQ